MSPDGVKRTVGEIEARDEGLVDIIGVMTLLFGKSLSHRQVEKQTEEESSTVYQCKG